MYRPDAHGQGPASRREAALPCGGFGLEEKNGGARLVDCGMAGPHIGRPPRPTTPSQFIFSIS